MSSERFRDIDSVSILTTQLCKFISMKKQKYNLRVTEYFVFNFFTPLVHTCGQLIYVL